MRSPERELLARFFQRNRWYFGHLLGLAAELGPDAADAEATGSYGSIRETLFHVVDALQLWDTRLNGTSPSELRLVPRDATDADLLAAVDGLTEAYIARLGDPGFDIAERFAYRSTRGDDRFNRRGDAVLQVASHASHHLAQVSTLLTQAGLSPEEGDYIYWVVMEEASG